MTPVPVVHVYTHTYGPSIALALAWRALLVLETSRSPLVLFAPCSCDLSCVVAVTAKRSTDCNQSICNPKAEGHAPLFELEFHSHW